MRLNCGGLSFKVAGIGEVLWDLLPGGKQLGGAPANFAYHAHELGAAATVISRVGRDELGRELVDRLEALGLPSSCIQEDPTAPTSTVSVSLNTAGHPEYVIHESVAWDNLAADPSALAAVAHVDAICFGTLAQRSSNAGAAIRSLVGATPKGAWRVFDVNLRQRYYTKSIIEESLALANVLKVNETELPVLAEMFALSGSEREIISQLAQRHELELVAFTRGERGSLLHRSGRWSDHPGLPIKVADTIGAGDSFTAAMTLGVLAGWELGEVNEGAARVAAFVASQSGATPRLPAELRSLFAR